MQPIDWLYRGARHRPDAIAVETDDARLTFATLVGEVEAFAAALQRLDPTPHHRVGICAYNTREHLVAVLATFAAGKVWVPLNPRNGHAELDAMIAATRPGVLVADERCVGRFSPTTVPFVYAHLESGRQPRDSVAGLVARHRSERPEPVERKADDAQIVKFSGGTTGWPKGVVQPVRCINAQAKGILTAFDLRDDDAFLVAAPLTHGTSCFVLPVLAAGGRLVLIEQFDAERVLDAFAARGITATYLPPTAFYSLLAAHGLAERAYPRLRHLVYSAAPMPPARIAEIRRAFGSVLETAYGQVEAPQIVTAMRAHEFGDERNWTSVGRPAGVVQVAVLAENGVAVPPGEAGEVAVQGDLVMTGYLDRPDLTAETIVNGWLRTGDLGVLDERGYLHLRGRTRDVINSGGFKIHPEAVEAALAQHPAVAECCVYGVGDPRWGEAVHAAVQLRTGTAASEEELIAFVKGTLDSVKAPKRVHLVPTLPRNANGKVSRREVRLMLFGRHGVEVA